MQFAEALDVGLRGFDGCRHGRGLVDKGVSVLAGDGVGGDEAGVALGLDAGVVGVGLSGIQVGLGLGQLLVHFGGGDLGQQIALPDFGADVVIPAGEVAGGPGVDGRIDVGGHVAGQHKARQGCAGFGGGDDDRGSSQLTGGLGQHFAGLMAAQNAVTGQSTRNKDDDGHGDKSLLRRDGSLLGRGFMVVIRLLVRIVFVAHEKLLRYFVKFVRYSGRLNAGGRLAAAFQPAVNQ